MLTIISDTAIVVWMKRGTNKKSGIDSSANSANGCEVSNRHAELLFTSRDKVRSGFPADTSAITGIDIRDIHSKSETQFALAPYGAARLCVKCFTKARAGIGVWRTCREGSPAWLAKLPFDLTLWASHSLFALHSFVLDPPQAEADSCFQATEGCRFSGTQPLTKKRSTLESDRTILGPLSCLHCPKGL